MALPGTVSGPFNEFHHRLAAYTHPAHPDHPATPTPSDISAIKVPLQDHGRGVWLALLGMDQDDPEETPTNQGSGPGSGEEGWILNYEFVQWNARSPKYKQYNALASSNILHTCHQRQPGL